MGWQDEIIPQDLTVEHQGAQVPFRDLPLAKESPDFGAFLKRVHDQHTELGRRVPLNGEPDKWRKDYLPKLYEGGIFKPNERLVETAGDPDKYVLNKPDGIPNEAWSEDMVKEVRQIAHEEGVSQKAVDRFLQTHLKSFGAWGQKLQVDVEKSKERVAQAAKELNVSPEQGMEMADRYLEKNFSQEVFDFLKDSGAIFHPEIAVLLMKAGMASGEDISRLGQNIDQSSQADLQASQQYLGEVMNPKHPDHQKWLAKDPEVLRKIDAGFQKAYPGQVTIT